MRKIKIALLMVAILLMAITPVWSAWTESWTGGGVVELTPDAAGDYESTVTYPNGLKIWAIVFHPSTANDVLVVRLNSLTGPKLVPMTSILGDEKILYLPPKTIKIFIERDDCTFITYGNVRVNLILY